MQSFSSLPLMPSMKPGCRVLNLLHGLRVGGKEKGVLQQVAWARSRGLDDRILVFDHPAGDSLRDLDPGGIPVIFLERGPGLDMVFVRSLRRLLLTLRPAIVHARSDTAMVYARLASMGLSRSRPKLVTTYHGYPSCRTLKGRLAARWAARSTAWISVVSEELGHRMVRHGWLRGFATIRNGVDPGQYQPGPAEGEYRRMLGIPREALVAANVARFDTNKRQALLIEASADLLGRHPSLHVVLVGMGTTRAHCEATAAGRERIHFLDRVDDVRAFLRELDLFVLCSDHEGLPRSLLEAMATGLPAVATRVGGVPELLEGGVAECGIMVPPGDPVSLASAMERYLLDPTLRARHGESARNRVVAHFTAEKTWERYEDGYAAALSDRPAPAGLPESTATGPPAIDRG